MVALLLGSAGLHAQTVTPTHAVFHHVNGLFVVEEINPNLMWRYGYDNMHLYTSNTYTLFALADIPKITFANQEDIEHLPTALLYSSEQELKYWQENQVLRVMASSPVLSVALITLAGEVIPLQGDDDSWLLPDNMAAFSLLQIVTAQGNRVGKLLLQP